MGRFSTTIQVKDNVGRMKFINSFCDIMKKRGFEPCKEDEGTTSYLLAFSEGGWVTLDNEDYTNDPKKARDDLKSISDELKTNGFSVEVADSDFAVLTLNNGDTAIVGDGSGYGIEEPSRGVREYWQPLLTNEKDWEKFSEIVEKDHGFVEDTLAELAGLLGITHNYIYADFEELSEHSDSDKNITLLYFKPADTKAKPMTLNAAFKKVFGEALEPLGFKLIKSKYPYFVRVVPGGEIIHVITLLNEPSYKRGEKCFKIFGGIATVYRDEIDLSQDPGVENINWMLSNASMADITNTKYDFAYKGGFQEFLFEIDNESEMLYELHHSLDVTQKIILPIITKAIDVYSTIECLNQMKMISGFSERLEGMLFLKTEKYADFFSAELKRCQEEYKEKLEQHIKGFTFEAYTKWLKKCQEVIEGEVAVIKEIVSNPEMLEKNMVELERRKAANVEILKLYGLEI